MLPAGQLFFQFPWLFICSDQALELELDCCVTKPLIPNMMLTVVEMHKIILTNKPWKLQAEFIGHRCFFADPLGIDVVQLRPLISHY